MSRGYFIVLEGIDGSGTTTQAHLLHETLESSFGRCLLTREPSDGPIGMLIRQILKGRLTGRDIGGGSAPFDPKSLALLFAADRLDHLQSEIVPAIKAGSLVVSDRYLLSSLAYQSVDAELTWVKEINRQAVKPDLTLFLDVPHDLALQRLAESRADTERFEKAETLERVVSNYRGLVSQARGNTVTIDGKLPVNEVRRTAWKAVEALITDKARTGA